MLPARGFLIRALRISMVTLAVVVILTGVSRPDVRLDPRVAPTFQAISLTLDADRPDFSGSVTVELQVAEAVSRFTFHAEDQEFGRLALSDAEGELQVQATHDDGVVTVTTAEPLKPGPYTLQIDFTGIYNTQAVGLYRMEEGGEGYLFTQFEAIDARKAFPCWDEPIYKIPYQMTLRVPQAHVAVTNTPLESETVADGWKTQVFRRTKPMPSYMLAIASGPLDSVPITGLSVPGRIYTVRGQSHLTGLAIEMTPPILAALEEYFGRPYPYEKLDFIAVPEYWPGAMENPGAVTFKDELLLVDSKLATVGQKRALASVTAHELAHMWFGNLVTLAWWDEMWLNESFATWMGDKISNGLYPQYKGELADRRGVQGLMNADARPSTKPIRGAVKTASDIYEDFGLEYGKGQKVLGMLEQWIGEDAFRKGVVDYVNAHAWGNARAADLWTALTKASDLRVDAPLASFLDQPGLPLVSVSVDPGGIVKLSQQRFLNHGVQADVQTWVFPLRLKVSVGGEVITRTVLVDGLAKTVEFKANVDWLMPDAGAFGYYRWSVPQPMMVRLARESQALLSAPERIAFLGNAAALLDHGTMSGGDFLEILHAFADDPEPEVVSTVVSGLGKVEAAFVPDDLRDEFAGYLRGTLRPILERFGFDRKPGEDEAISLFRPKLIAWLGHVAKEPGVQKRAQELARAYMKKPDSVDPALAGVALGIAARDGDQALFDAYRKKFESADTPTERSRYLGALGSFTDAKIRKQALRYALEGPLRHDEIFAIPGGIASESEADHDRAFVWLMENFDDVRSRMPPQFIAFMPFMAGGCSTERLQTARTFFMHPDRKVDGTANTLEKVADQVSDCVNLRAREGAAVAAYLQSTAASHAASERARR